MTALPPLLQPLVEHPMFDSSRYRRDFHQVGMLGKGGFGRVYHAVHRLDGLSYAVKQIPLSSSRIRKIQQQGQPGLNALLAELRILARLDHPNIVRYYGGWLECSMSETSATRLSIKRTERGLLEGIPSSGTDSRDAGSELPDTATDGASSASGAHMTRESRATVSWSTPKPSTVDGTALDDEDIESLKRDPIPDVVFEESTRASGANHGDSMAEVSESAVHPRLTLHIQMSLHPMTLSDFISPLNTTQHHHCFHLVSSLQILLAILDGVKYLHAEESYTGT